MGYRHEAQNGSAGIAEGGNHPLGCRPLGVAAHNDVWPDAQ